jgi:regulator of RNase E activity RraA
MNDTRGFADIPTTVFADVLGRAHVMDTGIRPLWSQAGRVAGTAFTVQCASGDNLMLHAAIYRAAPGSILVVDAHGSDCAVAGGNVCAVAQRRGIAAIVVDGVIRDVAEVRDAGFPVFGRGVTPVAGVKAVVAPLGEPVRCGGVLVGAGDVVVADDDGVVVVPADQAGKALSDATAKADAEANQTLDEWEADHRARIERLLAEKGFRQAAPVGEAGR